MGTSSSRRSSRAIARSISMRLIRLSPWKSRARGTYLINGTAQNFHSQMFMSEDCFMEFWYQYCCCCAKTFFQWIYRHQAKPSGSSALDDLTTLHYTSYTIVDLHAAPRDVKGQVCQGRHTPENGASCDLGSLRSLTLIETTLRTWIFYDLSRKQWIAL